MYKSNFLEGENMSRLTRNISYPEYEEVYEYIGNTNTHILHSLCGITYPYSNYENIRKNARTFSIEYIYEGEGVIQENNNIYKVSAGDFFILHANTYQHYYANPKNPWKKIFITIEDDPKFPNTILKLYDIENVTLVKGVNNPVHLDELFELFKSDKKDITHEMEKILFNMIVDIAKYVKQNRENESQLTRAKAYIDKRLNTRVPVKEVSDHVRLEVNYFTRIFKKEYGVPPHQYLLSLRLDSACFYLRSTQKTIKDIAFSCGFKSENNFCIAFKKQLGITPTNYRNQ